MPTRFRRTMRRLQPYLNRVEPWTIFLTYVMLGWCAFFAWFSPPNSAISQLNNEELWVQASMLTIAAGCSMYGHISDKIFVEEIGLIFGFFGIGLYLWVLTSFVISQDTFWRNGEIFGVMCIAILLLINRGLRIQVIMSSKWLKPNVDTMYPESNI